MEALSLESLLDILNWDSEDELVPVDEEIIRQKHSSCLNRLVFKSPDGQLWGTEYWRDYNNGIEDGPFCVYEVEAVTTVAYRRK